MDWFNTLQILILESHELFDLTSLDSDVSDQLSEYACDRLVRKLGVKRGD